ncbi:putative cytokinetic ring protein SteA [Corynebacterium pilosum]|uniref:Thiamin pyrophosphokinase, catalytic domain-containing protein n=1 Tax=Corynebacterium pilosum TaxID=35756 RepID=A0A376CPG4_9CORY|nr:putative cytokinetic ring protein SteA [Corynebacterium pilosum]STC70381.1 Thiamin pyrophosphokinase, catalytic domain-containing protein [Corynebacterium pilosum]
MSSKITSTSDHPGLQGALRDCTPQGKGLKRLKAGEIAVIDAPDLSRRQAQALVDARPAAVVNIAEFSTGAIPNYGPHILLDSDVALYENAGAELRAAFRDGKKGGITEDGEIYVGKKTVGKATELLRGDADANFNDAQRHLVDHMEAYFGNTIEFIHSEAPLLIDGVGVPDLGDDMDGRKVLIVSPEQGHRERIAGLRNFIREFNPVLIGVAAAADTLMDLGYKPEYIVGNPKDVASETLRGDARVILPADPDGHAEGLERIQDLGVGAMTFPSALDNPTDLAVLLAVFHDAQMIVTVGERMDLDAIFSNRDYAQPASLLTWLKGGGRIVDASVIENLYNVSSGRGVAWAWAILGVLVAVAVIILVVGLGGDDSFTNNLIDTWNSIALTVQGWFN